MAGYPYLEGSVTRAPAVMLLPTQAILISLVYDSCAEEENGVEINIITIAYRTVSKNLFDMPESYSMIHVESNE